MTLVEADCCDEQRWATIQLSATDLVGHLNCRHLTQLDLAVIAGELSKPKLWDPLLEVLAERGAQHEQGYIDHLKAEGFSVTAVDGVGIDDNAVAGNRQAHESWRADYRCKARCGTGIGEDGQIFCGALKQRANSALGRMSRLTQNSHAKRAAARCCSYASTAISSRRCKAARRNIAHVVVPWSQYQPQTFRVLDYAAYYRRVKISLETAVSAGRKWRPIPTQRNTAKSAAGASLAIRGGAMTIICA